MKIGADRDWRDGVGDRDGPGERPAVGQFLAQGGRAERRIAGFLATEHRVHVAAEPSSKIKAGVLKKLFPAHGDALRRIVPATQRAFPQRLPQRVPFGPHVGERSRPRFVVLEVADELAENPLLIGILNPDVVVHHERAGQDSGPRQVVQVDVAVATPVNVNRMMSVDGRQLVADREKPGVALLLHHVQIGFELLALEFIVARLDLDQQRPRRLPANRLEHAIHADIGTVRQVKGNFAERGQFPRGRSQRLEDGALEFVNRGQHRQKRGRCPALLLVVALNARHGNEAGGLPVFLLHVPLLA